MRWTLIALLMAACGTSEPGPAHPGQDPPEQDPGVRGDDHVPDLPSPEEFAVDHPSSDAYRHAGLAELSRFELRQSRYGEVRDGEAVLVFVTEPFLEDAQVKHEVADGRPDVSVLKLNAYRRFYTGIYPYTVMTSTFVPERDDAMALKLTGTVIEWCGQAFTQFNRRDDGVHAQLRSYFQAEGDRDAVLPNVMLEDALWQRVRRGPSALPTGELELIPAVHALRFAHRALAAMPARARLEEVDGHQRYTVEIPSLGRRLQIDFGSEFPYAILGWEETLGNEVSTARRTHAVMTDYWSHHGEGDAGYREALGLTM